jgi:hypothetical protein
MHLTHDTSPINGDLAYRAIKNAATGLLRLRRKARTKMILLCTQTVIVC